MPLAGVGLFAHLGYRLVDNDDEFQTRVGGEIRNLVLDGQTLHGSYIVGGLVGINSGSIHNVGVDNAYIDGIMTVGSVAGWNDEGAGIDSAMVSSLEIRGGTAVGGIAGVNFGSLHFNEIEGSVFADADKVFNLSNTHLAGGVTAINFGQIYYAVTEVQLSSRGTLRPETLSWNSFDADLPPGEWVAGIAALNGGLIEQTQVNQTIESSTRILAAADGALGDANLGGVVGKNFPFASVSESSFLGALTASNRLTGEDRRNHIVAGGLVAVNRGTIRDSYSNGAVAINSPDDNVGGFVLGGLIGEHRSEPSTTMATVSFSYASGLLNSQVSLGESSHQGGLIGVSDESADVDSCYWDPISTLIDESAGGIALDTADFDKQESFSGWDTTDVWDFATFEDSGSEIRPRLRWEL